MNKFLRFILLIAILALCWYLGRYFNFDIEYYKEILNRYPKAVSGSFFIFLYVFISFFVWLGKDVFWVVSALLYGPYLSAILIYFGELINATILFHLSRTLGQDFVRKQLSLKNKDDVERTKGSSGFFGAFTLRLILVIPYRFQDLGAGLTSISFGKYLAAIAIAQIPRILFVQYLIAAVGTSIFKNVKAVSAYMQDHPEAVLYSNLYVFLMILATVAYVINKGLQKKRPKLKRAPAPEV